VYSPIPTDQPRHTDRIDQGDFEGEDGVITSAVVPEDTFVAGSKGTIDAGRSEI